MSEMVERAGRALVPFYYGATGDGGGHGDCWKGRADDLARAALLAALDIEDSALIDVAATGIMDAEGTPWGVSRNYARAAIAALKAAAQGEHDGSET